MNKLIAIFTLLLSFQLYAFEDISVEEIYAIDS